MLIVTLFIVKLLARIKIFKNCDFKTFKNGKVAVIASCTTFVLKVLNM